MVEVWTARISTKDPDAYDVTIKSGDRTFAPSWSLFKPMLDRRRAGRRSTDEEWQAYARAYLLEMRESRRARPGPWRALLARPRVVLTCYCTEPQRCHRTLLGRFLAKLGATYHGELEPPEDDSAQRAIFDLVQELD